MFAVQFWVWLQVQVQALGDLELEFGWTTCNFSINVQSEGKVIYAMDALFGLPRKRAAGVSYRPAVQANLFFLEQSCVDEHVAGAKAHKLMENVCLTICYYKLSLSVYQFICTCMYYCRTAVTFWLEMLYEVLQDTNHLMRLVYLDVPVDMNFQSYFWI